MSTHDQKPVGVMRAPSEAGVAPYAEQRNSNAAIAAIAYVLEHPCDSPMEFLRCWNEGNFDALRAEWPAVPAEVFIGADPLFKPEGDLV